jgi:hypothetical protein
MYASDRARARTSESERATERERSLMSLVGARGRGSARARERASERQKTCVCMRDAFIAPYLGRPSSLLTHTHYDRIRSTRAGSALTGAAECNSCPGGTYSSATGASSSATCASCTAGNFATAGASSVTVSPFPTLITNDKFMLVCINVPMGQYMRARCTCCI